jgi:hypothetical protein
MSKPPKTRKYRGKIYYLLPTSFRNTKVAANKVAWIRRRYVKRVHVKKFGNGYYVYSSNE